MLIKLTSQNCAFFLWRAGKFFSFSCSFHQGSSGIIPAPPSHSRMTSDTPGDGAAPLPWPLLALSCWVSGAGPARVATLASCRGGSVEGRDLEGVLYQHTQVMETGNTCGEWPGQAGAAVALLIPLSEAEPQGCRGCRTWELQLGGPTEEEEERMWEVFYCVPVQCCPLCIQIRAAHSYIK